MRVALFLFAAAALTVGVLVLRDATLSTHEPVAADSQLAVVVHARSNGAEAGQTLAEQAEALVLVCRLEVTSDPTGPLEAIGDDRFRFVLEPSLDDTDRRQFQGCLEDWAIDHLLLSVESMQEP